MKISANSIRHSYILEHHGELWIVSKTPEHTKPGKGPAYVQVEMKSIKRNNKMIERFSSSDHVEKVELEQKTLQFLYFEDGNLLMMDQENFEQIVIDKKILGDKLPFVTDGIKLTLEFYNGEPIAAHLPSALVVEIADTPPVIKGATVTASYKPATLTNGVKVSVPSYLSIGEKILIKTEDVSFVERVK
jgi:elongation factor P